MSGDAIAILACLDLSDEEWGALDAELTEIEASADMARLEREMAQPPACANDSRHGDSRVIAPGQRYLCASCYLTEQQRRDVSRRPVGVAQRGGSAR